MIDTAKPHFHMTSRVFNRLQNHKALQRLGTNFYGNKLYLTHPFGLGNPAVWFDLKKRYFQIETSLPKLFQGHNVGGVDKLEYLCLQTAELIYRQLGLEFTGLDPTDLLGAAIGGDGRRGVRQEHDRLVLVRRRADAHRLPSVLPEEEDRQAE